MTTSGSSADSEVEALCEALDEQQEGPYRTNLLIALLTKEGHDRHEDIVFELGLLGEAAAVPAIEQAVATPFASLVEWGNVHEFQRKCAYALARIGTAQSRSVLQRLSEHSDPKLREYGAEGLSVWPLKE